MSMDFGAREYVSTHYDTTSLSLLVIFIRLLSCAARSRAHHIFRSTFSQSQKRMTRWSNLAYIFAAILLWRTKTNKPSIRARLNYFSLAITLCGIGSFIYHASNNRLTQFLDFLGMFAVAVRTLHHLHTHTHTHTN